MPSFTRVRPLAGREGARAHGPRAQTAIRLTLFDLGRRGVIRPDCMQTTPLAPCHGGGGVGGGGGGGGVSSGAAVGVCIRSVLSAAIRSVLSAVHS